jgi:hypothetical protein
MATRNGPAKRPPGNTRLSVRSPSPLPEQRSHRAVFLRPASPAAFFLKERMIYAGARRASLGAGDIRC